MLKRPALPITILVVLILFTGFAGLSLVPALFGKDVGAGFASVERSLCALGPDGSAKILVGGDSRAKLLVNPLILDSMLGRKAINIAEMVNFGGDPPTLVNVLRKYPQVLASEPILVMSVSVPGLNDLDLGGLTASAVLNWRAWDHARVAWIEPRIYSAFLFDWYLPYMKRHILHKLRGDGYVCEEGETLPPAQMASLGFRPDTSRFDPAVPDPRRKRPVSRAQFLLDGARLRSFRESLEWLVRSPVKAIVLYNAPIVPGWGNRGDHAVDMEVEEEFAAIVSKESGRHPKVRFLDFVREPPPDLGPEHFCDNYHLNDRGAALFSRRLGAYLLREGL